MLPGPLLWGVHHRYRSALVMQNVASRIVEERPPDDPQSAVGTAQESARIAASLSSDHALLSRRIWTTLLHSVLPLLAGGAAYWFNGEPSVALVRQAWPGLGLLVGAYVAAVVLHTKLDQFPFIHSLETALLSVSATMIPAGGVVIGMLGTPLDTLGLAVTGSGVGWYVLTQLLQTSPDTHRSGWKVGTASPLLVGPTMEAEMDRHRSEAPGLADLGETTFDPHASVVTGQNGRAHDSTEGAPVGHAGCTHPVRATRASPGASSDATIMRRTDRSYQYVKRAMDVLVVVLSLPVTLPLIAVTALAVRLGSKGPVLFWQERVGQGGETFQMVKFRSMYVGHEGEDHAVFTDEDDDRVTTVGRLIRATRLDELPQIWNVLRGEMSLIGPRPEQVGLADDFSDALRFYDVRHLVRPGITGWAQVVQGYAADVDETRRKLEHDLYYVTHRSVLLDLLIVYLTLKTLLTGFGAR